MLTDCQGVASKREYLLVVVDDGEFTILPSSKADTVRRENYA
ncbi:MAG: hypothetical protein ACYTBX_10940 [Planctomycetota bacterium]